MNAHDSHMKRNFCHT